MKNAKILFVVLIVGQYCWGQCPEYDLQLPQLKNIVVKSFITQNTDSRIFTYRYAITNGVTSTGCINNFELNITYPQNTVELSQDGLVDYHRYVARSALKLAGAQKIIPVGIPKLPRFGRFSSAWSAGFSIDGIVDWFGADRMFYIQPGTTLDSLILTTYGLPGLRYFIVSPSYNPKPLVEITPENEDSVYNNVPEPTAEETEAFLRLVDSIKWRGITVGPTATPLNFIALDWCDTLLSYTHQSVDLGWIKQQSIAEKYLGYFNSVKTNFQQNNIGAVRITLNNILHDIDIDSISTLTSEAYALIRYNTEYLVGKLPPPGLIVKLINSSGTKLTSGALQYYEGSWKDAVSNNDGTFIITTNQKTLSLRMTYEYGSQTKSNVPVGSDTVVFQTVNAQIKLQNSQGNPIDTGTVQYYAGAWRNLGSTTNGIASKELLAGTYSFRMTYAYASKDKQQDLSSNSTVVFQTVNAKVQLQNSLGNLIDQGTVQYYSGAWRTLGTTMNGTVSKELLPNSYSFRMTYEYVSNDKTQDLSTNNTVNFSTVLCTVRVKNSQNQPVDNALASYYSGAWRQIGSTVNGEITKELLPANLSFRVKVGTVQQDKTQNLSTSSVVEFLVQP